MYSPPRWLEKYVSRAHDLKLDEDCGHCLYMTEPQQLDVSDLYTCMDLTHTMYYDHFERFALYRRDRYHLIKMINLEDRPHTGVIFMDCWESNAEWPYQYDWDYSPLRNFYQRMIENVWQYNLYSLVFTLSDFSPQPITHILQDWAGLPWSTYMSSLDQFVEHIEKTGINDWILVGGHWGFCTHDKAMGFHDLRNLKIQKPFLRFFSIPDSTAKFIRNYDARSILTVCSEKDYITDDLRWDYRGKIAELLV